MLLWSVLLVVVLLHGDDVQGKAVGELREGGGGRERVIGWMIVAIVG